MHVKSSNGTDYLHLSWQHSSKNKGAETISTHSLIVKPLDTRWTRFELADYQVLSEAPNPNDKYWATFEFIAPAFFVQKMSQFGSQESDYIFYTYEENKGMKLKIRGQARSANVNWTYCSKTNRLIGLGGGWNNGNVVVNSVNLN